MNWKNLLLSRAICQTSALRYIKFIETFSNTGGSIKHHILPKSSHFWPEYEDLREYTWNNSSLTNRQHYVAHWLLSRALGGTMIDAFWAMTNQSSERINSRTYETLLEQFADKTSKRQKSRAKAGEHNWQREDHKQKIKKQQLKRAEAGEHVWQKEEHREFMRQWNAEQVANGTHPLSTHAGPASRERIKNGTHNLLTNNPAKEASAKGEHWLSGVVNVVDRHGNRKKISKTDYNNQVGDKNQLEFVHCSSKEAKKRLNDRTK